MHWIAIALGGALGAMARYAVVGYLTSLHPGRFPYGTLVVNALGSLLIGVVYVLIVEKSHIDQQWRHVIMVGFLGAFTTFSTFSLEAYSLWQSDHLAMALSYILLSVVICLLAVASGILLAQKIF